MSNYTPERELDSFLMRLRNRTNTTARVFIMVSAIYLFGVFGGLLLAEIL